MNELEKDFLASLKSLLVRYNVKIEKEYSGFDDEGEKIFMFSNDEGERENEIYLNLGEFLNYLNSR